MTKKKAEKPLIEVTVVKVTEVRSVTVWQAIKFSVAVTTISTGFVIVLGALVSLMVR